MKIFWAMCKNPKFTAKNEPSFLFFFLIAFLPFSTRLLWFRAKSAFFIVGEIIAFFAHFYVHV